MTKHFFTLCALVSALLAAGCSTVKKAEQKPAEPTYFKVDRATAGTIVGEIRYTGKRPAPAKKVDMDEDPQCAKLHTHPVYDNSLEIDRKGEVGNVFVYIKKGLEGKKFEPPSAPVVIDQHGCWFVPRVIGMQTGQQLEATNSDPVTHNIHPRAHVNREWNQNQPEGAPPAVRKFNFPEIMIRVKCNIHAWMKAWIGVVDKPYFAVTGDDGGFSLKNVPPGVYTLEAWQEDLGTQEQQVTVAASGASTVNFTFTEVANQ